MEDCCCVYGCQKRETDEGVLLHKLPRNARLKRNWLESVTLKPNSPDVPLVCSDHFTENDYKVVKHKRILKTDACPSIFNVLEGINVAIDKNCDRLSDNSAKDDVNCNSNINNKILNESNKINDVELKINTNSDETSNKELNEVALEKDSKDSRANIGIEQELETEILDDSEKGICDTDNAKHVNSELDLSVNVKDDSSVNKNLVKKVTEKVQVAVTDFFTDPKLDLEENIPSFIIVENQRAPRVEVSVPSFEAEEVIGAVEIENMEVSIDPTFLMVDEPNVEAQIDLCDSDVEISKNYQDPIGNKEPVSLLTSSDEDDVILQEPKYDLVEVSDETSEDDQPLIRLKNKTTEKTDVLKNILLKKHCCYLCNFTTNSDDSFERHRRVHFEVHFCPHCPYRSYKLSTYKKHLSLHKNEKRYKCHLCPYKSKHHISLAYHLKNHDLLLKCGHCSFASLDREKFLRHEKSHKSYKHCDLCLFKSKSSEALVQHQKQNHLKEIGID